MRAAATPVFRWAGSLTVAVGMHAAIALILLNRTPMPVMPPPAPDAVTLDLSPELPPLLEASAPQPVPLAAEPPQVVPPAEPPPPSVTTDIVLPEPPRPPPPAPPRPHPPPRLRSAVERQVPAKPQPDMPVRDEAPARTAPTAAPAPPSNAMPTWRMELLGRLQRAKRYPESARRSGDKGVATVAFTMDRSGRVLGVTLVGSSGSAALDEEAVALVRRAEPLPSIPADIEGNSVTLTVPVNFTFR